MEQQVSELKHQLAEAEQNTILAATYGKQLLDKNNELEAKLETLQQEKHCLALKLEARAQMEHSLELEVEQLREHQAHQMEMLAVQAAQSHDQDLQKHTRKILDLESIIGSQRLEIAQGNEGKELLKAQLKEAQERLESFNKLDQSVNDNTSLLQVAALTQEKQELETLTSSLKVQLGTYKHRAEEAEKKVVDLESALEEKECQFTSYYNALEKNKEEMMEMKMEIESLKLAETDPAKKGNSLFAEVEDQRQIMEKQLINYKTNYNILKKQYDLKTQEAAKLKLQVASLLSLSSNRASMEYVSHLEESLTSSRSQLETLTQQCRQLDKAQHSMSPAACQEGLSEAEGGSAQLLSNLYAESKRKISELNQSLREAQFNKVVLSDRILQLQRKLRQMESSRDVSAGEAIRLRVKLNDLKSKKGEKTESDIKVVKRVVEKLPDFDTRQQTTTTTHTTAEPDTAAQQDQQEAFPLKEKLLDRATMLEVTKSTRNVDAPEASSEGDKEAVKAENEENLPPVKAETKKKAKKVVQLTEVVHVLEEDGQVQETQMKQEDGFKKPEKKQRIRRKLECPVMNVKSSEHNEECKTQ